MIEQCLIGKMDIFCMGVVLGAISIVLARAFERGMKLWLDRNQMKLDLMLGQAILKMKQEIERGSGDEK